jgi:hypothetical protein
MDPSQKEQMRPNLIRKQIEAGRPMTLPELRALLRPARHEFVPFAIRIPRSLRERLNETCVHNHTTIMDFMTETIKEALAPQGRPKGAHGTNRRNR